MKKTLSVSEARSHLAEITDDVAFNGAEYVLTKNDKAVAKITSSQNKTISDELFDKYLNEFMDEYSDDLTELASL